MSQTRDTLPALKTGPGTMVRQLAAGTYNPNLSIGSRGSGELTEGPCRALNASSDGSISFYDYSNTLIENYAIAKGINPIGILGLTAANVTIWGIW